MKTTKITRKNISMIYGKVQNFFQNKAHTGFEVFYNFNCGFNHINPVLEHLAHKPDTTRELPDVIASDGIVLTCPIHREKVGTGKTWKFDTTKRVIHLNLTATYHMTIKEGDRITFLGSRIIIKSRTLEKDIFKYTVFTQKAMPSSKKQAMHAYADRMRREWEHAMEEERKKQQRKWMNELEGRLNIENMKKWNKVLLSSI